MHNPYIPDTIKAAARNLRKNMTPSEIKLWEKIKDKKLNFKFQRQRPLYLYSEDSGLDRYIIPDFCCLEKNILIEIDGGVHLEKDILELDKTKEKLVTQKGFTLLRFTNEEVTNNIPGVLSTIQKHLIM